MQTNYIEDLSGATITNNSEHGPPRSPGGLGHVRRLQLDPGEEDSSDSDVEPDDGEADLGAGSPVLEVRLASGNVIVICREQMTENATESRKA